VAIGAIDRPAVRQRRSLLRREARDAYIFLAPWIIGFLVFTAGPMIVSIGLLFTNWEIITPPKFIGLGNIQELFHDRLFFISLGNTLFYVFLYVPLYLVLALIIALAMNVKLKGINFYRVLYYLPSQTPVIASAILWLWIFNPEFGLANAALDALHLPPQKWIFDPNLSKPCLIFMGLWGAGGGMVIFLAGLQGIPENFYEAASIDGATTWGRFWNITLPMLSPVIFFQLIIGIIGTFTAGFTQAYVMTGGGPENSTLLYVLYLYQNAFQYFHMGYASALAWVLFLIIMLFTGIQFRIARSWVYYEGDLK